MNPYVSATIAMCLIAVLSLALTAYLAAMFNRRAKADLNAALTPLAELIDGDVQLEDATVRGRYGGHLVEGRMANASEGHGRVFQSDLIDPAGGEAWTYTSTPAKDFASQPSIHFESPNASLEERLVNIWDSLITGALNARTERFRLEYDPGAGRIRLTRPMRTRRDLPEVTAFLAQLELLVRVADENRRVQGPVEEHGPVQATKGVAGGK